MQFLIRKTREWELGILAPLLIIALYRIFSHPVWLVWSGRGLPLSQDGEWYLNYARGLLETFTIRMNIDEILYMGYNLLLTAMLAIFKDPVAVIYLQALLASLAVILVYLTGKTLFNRRTGILASLFYLYNWDVTLWSTYLLSDSLFVSLLLLTVFLLIRAVDAGHSAKRRWLVFLLTALYLFFFRPTGVVVVTMMLLYILVRADRSWVLKKLQRLRFGLICSLGGLLIFVGFLIVSGRLDSFFQSLQYNVKLVMYNIYAKGQIYDIPTRFDYFFRPDYTINIGNSLAASFIANNWEAVSVLYFRRAVAFLGIWTWMIKPQNLADWLFFLYCALPSLFFVWGTIAAINDGKFKRASILWFIVVAVFFFCVLLFIDSMYRYRFPAMPFVGMIAAYGLDRMISGGCSLAKRHTCTQ